MEESEQAINVPFVDHKHLDYGGKQNRSELADELIEREFGNIDQLIVTKDKVELAGEALVDLNENNSDPTNSSETSSLDNSIDNGADQNPSFIVRQIDNGNGLRIAVQTSLNLAQRPALRQLITELKNSPAENYEIDLNFCSDMSITGIGILLMIRKNIGEDQKNITVKNCNEFILQLLNWAGMENCFQLQGK